MHGARKNCPGQIGNALLNLVAHSGSKLSNGNAGCQAPVHTHVRDQVCSSVCYAMFMGWPLQPPFFFRSGNSPVASSWECIHTLGPNLVINLDLAPDIPFPTLPGFFPLGYTAIHKELGASMKAIVAGQEKRLHSQYPQGYWCASSPARCSTSNVAAHGHRSHWRCPEERRHNQGEGHWPKWFGPVSCCS